MTDYGESKTSYANGNSMIALIEAAKKPKAKTESEPEKAEKTEEEAEKTESE